MRLYDFTFYAVIKRNARCFKQRPALFEVSDGRELTFDQIQGYCRSSGKGFTGCRVKEKRYHWSACKEQP